MKDSVKIIKSIEKKITQGLALPYMASETAYELFILLYVLEEDRKHAIQLLEKFHNILQGKKWGSLADHQARYAIRIAEANGTLLYEEMHKLFSLCDEIYAMENLGIILSEDLKNDFEYAIRQRFKKEQMQAQTAAQHNVEDWNKNLWWYKEFI
jgi:hypothetical protein